ncbi:hypothetical protein [Burkholderia lata]|uniref:Lactate permease n=1 Tax=Burkholderia lata (strain ATCC 17760 / DSM 23089 / LMG 22485 / NCIMB 9086 / R18194 / 383) TaxID=482957 RepID=A0A6P2X0G2_BURL3|nr:hypothetical protein [Burkholderia lata]VWD02693.1 hypothetical protein BLA18109_04681 [Burkholderia lata]
MSTSVDRFQRRKALTSRERSPEFANGTPVPESSTDGQVDEALLATLATDGLVMPDLSVHSAEVDAILKEVTDVYNRDRLEATLEKCKSDVIQSIVGPFGLGKFISAYDKRGGNVDTVHNVRNGVWATDAEREKHESRDEYDPTPYHTHADYKAKNAETSAGVKAGTATDAVTGKVLQHKQKQLDHVVSAKETHDDAGITLAELDHTDMANRPDNLAPTHFSINTSKKDKSMSAYLAWLDEQKESRDARIEVLASKPELSDKERKELGKLKEQASVDEARARELDEKARKDRDGEVNRKYYTSEKFALHVLGSGLAEGARMGAQQVIGAAVAEFLVALVDEIQDWYRNGRKDINFKVRFGRVRDRVISRWKEFLAHGLQGALSGFISNLATVVINAFVTTHKRVARMVREGVFSMFRAFKTIIVRPEGMTYQQAMHEASKLAFGGALVIGGVAVEEVLVRQFQAIGLGLIADVAGAVIVGSLVAIATLLCALTLDHLDLFGAEAAMRDEQVGNMLKADTEASMAECERMLQALATGAG